MQIHKSQKIELLRQVDLLASCSTKELGQIAALTTEVDVEAGRALMKRGEAGLEFFVIVEGTAVVTRKGIDIARRGPGSFCGELALLDHGPRTATVIASTQMRLLVLTRLEFSRLIVSVPSVALNMLTELGSRLRATDEMLDFPAALVENFGARAL